MEPLHPRCLRWMNLSKCHESPAESEPMQTKVYIKVYMTSIHTADPVRNQAVINQLVFSFYLIHRATLFIIVSMSIQSKVHFVLVPKLTQVFAF